MVMYFNCLFECAVMLCLQVVKAYILVTNAQLI